MSKNAGNVAGGLKATLNNPNVGQEAKDNAQDRLDRMEDGAPVEEVMSGSTGHKASGEKNPGNVAGGYKATLKNPNVSEDAKQHAKDMLDEL